MTTTNPDKCYIFTAINKYKMPFFYNLFDTEGCKSAVLESILHGKCEILYHPCLTIIHQSKGSRECFFNLNSVLAILEE